MFRKIETIKWIDVRKELPPKGEHTPVLVSVSLVTHPELGQHVFETEYDARDPESVPRFENIDEDVIVTHWARMPKGAKIYHRRIAT